MIKLIAIDMDNTLLNDKKQIPAEFNALVNACKARDICVVIASGRPLYTLKEMFAECKDDLSFIADNGGLVEYQKQIISQDLMKKEIVEKIVSEAYELEDSCVILCGIEHASVDKRRLMDESYIREFYKTMKVVDDLSTVHENIDKVTLYSRTHIRSIFESYIRPNYGETYECVVSDTVWADITNRHVNKGNGIRQLLKTMGIDRSEAMAFGDFDNDIEMLKAVEESYVMANAPEYMHQYGKHIAPSNNEQGVIKVIKEKVLQID